MKKGAKKNKHRLLAAVAAKKKQLLLALGIVVLLAAFLVAAFYCIGVSDGGLEADAQKRQGIDEGWSCYTARNQTMAALLFFDGEQAQYACTVYAKKDGLFYGYFFVEHVSNPAIAEGVLDISYQGEAMALLSLNKKHVAQIVTDLQTIHVNPDAPFSHMLPQGAEDVTLYDAQGGTVDMVEITVP